MTDWTNVIELICDKLGIVVDSAMELVPEIVKYNQVVNGFWTLIFFICLVTGIFLIRSGWNYAKRNGEKSGYGFRYHTDEAGFILPVALGGFLSLVGSIFFFDYCVKFLTWFVAPNISAIQWAIELVGG